MEYVIGLGLLIWFLSSFRSDDATVDNDFDRYDAWKKLMYIHQRKEDRSYKAFLRYEKESKQLDIEAEKRWAERKKIELAKERWIKRFKNLTPESGHINDPYYIYFYVIEGEVKYVGKGTVVNSGELRYQRAADIYSHKYCKPYTREITVRIIETFKEENNVLKRESELIAFYGINNLLNKKK